MVAAQAVCKDLPAELERGAWKGRVPPVRASVVPAALVRARASEELAEAPWGQVRASCVSS